jgi:hypothetical protein
MFRRVTRNFWWMSQVCTFEFGIMLLISEFDIFTDDEAHKNNKKRKFKSTTRKLWTPSVCP